MFKSITLPLIITLFFHGIIVAVMLVNMPEAEPMLQRAPPKFIQAKLVTLDKLTAKKTLPSKPAVKKKPKPKPVVKNNDNKAAQLKAKQQADKRAKAVLEAKSAKELERQQAIKQQQQKNKRLQEQAQRELTEAIDRENAAQQTMDDTELSTTFVAIIANKIQQNWNRPPIARNGMEVVLMLQFVPTGEVVSVNVLRSSGNPVFDRSAENAVLRAERFPELQQLPSHVFEKDFRRLTLKFRPEDLRL